jgi:hypothetical protein
MVFEWIWIALLGLAKRKREYTVDMFARLARNGVVTNYTCVSSGESGFRARS